MPAHNVAQMRVMWMFGWYGWCVPNLLVDDKCDMWCRILEVYGM